MLLQKNTIGIICKIMKKEDIKDATFSSITGGYDSFLLRDIYAQNNQKILYITSSGVQLQRAVNVLQYLEPEAEVLAFPAWDTVPYDRASPNSQIISQRLKTLSSVLQNKGKQIIVASVSSVMQKVVPQSVFDQSNMQIKVGQTLNVGLFTDFVISNGYQRVEQVLEPGEFALRGDIIDIFPTGTEQPLRIDLFSEEVERIRTFDVISQRTTGQLDEYTIGIASEVMLTPASVKTFREKYRALSGSDFQNTEIYEAVSQGQNYSGIENWLPLFYEQDLPTIFDYLPDAIIVIGTSVESAVTSKQESIKDYYQARLDGLQIKSATDTDRYYPVPVESMYLSKDEIFNIFKQRHCTYFSALTLPISDKVISTDVIPPRNFLQSGGIKELNEYLNANGKLKRIIACYSPGSQERISQILNRTDTVITNNWQDSYSYAAHKKIAICNMELDEGFKTKDLCVISEQEILGARQHRKIKKVTSKDFISDISGLNIGELIVHIEHGTGRFLGLESLSAGGIMHDCLKLEYAGSAKLYVPVENIEVLSRYGFDDENIVLDTIGGASWSLKKDKVKSKIKDIAEQLIKLAAQRQLKSADVYTASVEKYDQFCSGFGFAETQDQLNAIADVSNDLKAGIPMDRLVCGDVGFGKTEVALRAAFEVASSGAQVAVVVPTTLLARQHYQNFKQRFKDFPIRVKMLSRLVSAKEAKQTKQELKDGALEIVIGTHALLAKDISFCNLGLLIIDEEQHFGVTHKEKLKSLKADVHVLTLTATPIPRTLQLSLTGVKQLSIIATPPLDRLAVRSFVMPFDSVLIKEAIYREKFRGGQTFFVCPRVSDIEQIKKQLQTIAPDAKIAVAHGQMPVSQLEDVMTDFADGKADILLATTIVQSGIDMPNVNTMIIHRADMFGLAQLYQLKGRIGRAKRRGYCYFTIPKQKHLKPIAQKRLEVLQALDNLGAGFSLASYDMDIRGCGNVLGDEQSGHIKDVGMSLYHHMLEEEINRQKAQTMEEIKEGRSDFSPVISVSLSVQIPQTYITDFSVRLNMYKRIAQLSSAEEILEITEELIDRFGKLPSEVQNLLDIVKIKLMCKSLNIERVDAGQKGILVKFRNNQFANPEKLIEFIAKSFGKVIIRPDETLLFVNNTTDNVLEQIENKLKKLQELA